MTAKDKDATKRDSERDLSSLYVKSMHQAKPTSDSDRLILSAAEAKAQSIGRSQRHSNAPFFGNEQFAIWKAAAATSIAGVCLWVVLQPSAPLPFLDEVMPVSSAPTVERSVVPEFVDVDSDSLARSSNPVGDVETTSEARESDKTAPAMAPAQFQASGRSAISEKTKGSTLNSTQNLAEVLVDNKTPAQVQTLQRQQQVHKRQAEQRSKLVSNHSQKEERAESERLQMRRQLMPEELQQPAAEQPEALEKRTAAASAPPSSLISQHVINTELEELGRLVDDKDWPSACELYKALIERDVEIDTPQSELLESRCTDLPEQ